MEQEQRNRPGGAAQSQSLYRKHRPRSFAPDELVGQEHIARTLRNAIMLDRVAHAYLFCGPRGTGKTSTARLLAKAVNCLDPDPETRPCNECEACQTINSGAAVDIIEIDAASNRGVDDIRDLREKVKYAPTQLRVKFYIIDEAHQLTRDAFNAFLKTLEEPPAHVKFVLATTEGDKLPDTVASRCQRFDFRRIPLTAVVERLQHVCHLEGLEVEDEALRMIARQTTGSLRDALGLLDQLALFGSSQDGQSLVTADAVRSILGLSRSDRLVGLVDALARRDAGSGLRLIAEAAESGEDIHQLTRQLVGYLRMLLHVRAGGRDDDADESAREQAQAFSLAELANLVRAFSSIEPALNRGSYAQLPLELAFVEAIAGPRPVAAAAEPSTRSVDISSPSATPRTEPTRQRSPAVPARSREPEPPPEQEDPPTTIPKGPVPAPQPASASEAPAAPAAAAPVDQVLDRLVSTWTQIRREVKVANSRVAALLGSVDPVAVRDDEVILVSAYEFHRNKINEDAIRRVVEDVISRRVGGTYRLTCVAPDDPMLSVAGGTNGGGTPPVSAAEPAPQGNGSEVAPASAEPEADERDEERLRAARSIFGADEVDPSE